MGVDYRAFAGYGAPIELRPGVREDLPDPTWDLAEIANGTWSKSDATTRKEGERCRFDVQEWGGMSYGGDGGYVLILSESGGNIDVKRGGKPQMLADANADWYEQMIQAIKRLVDAGVADQRGDVGWYVGGRVC